MAATHAADAARHAVHVPGRGAGTGRRRHPARAGRRPRAARRLPGPDPVGLAALHGWTADPWLPFPPEADTRNVAAPARRRRLDAALLPTAARTADARRRRCTRGIALTSSAARRRRRACWRGHAATATRRWFTYINPTRAAARRQRRDGRRHHRARAPTRRWRARSSSGELPAARRLRGPPRWHDVAHGSMSSQFSIRRAGWARPPSRSVSPPPPPPPGTACWSSTSIRRHPAPGCSASIRRTSRCPSADVLSRTPASKAMVPSAWGGEVWVIPASPRLLSRDHGGNPTRLRDALAEVSRPVPRGASSTARRRSARSAPAACRRPATR